MQDGVAFWPLALAVVGSLMYVAVYQRAPPGLSRTVSKAVGSGGILLFAVINGAPPVLIAGLVVAVFSDIILSIGQGQRYLMIALFVALISHALFSFSFATNWVGLENPLVAGLGLVGFGSCFFILIWARAGAMLMPSVLYIASISVMSVMAFGSADPLKLASFGAILYGIQAVVHGVEQFMTGPKSEWRRITAPVIWLIYASSLLMFALGDVLAA